MRTCLHTKLLEAQVNTQYFHSTIGYKVFAVLGVLFAGIVTLGYIYLYSLSKAPLLVGLVFLAITVLLAIRAVNLCRYPEICFDGQSISIRGWFGGIKKIDPYTEMDVAGTLGAYVIKQGNVAAVLVPQVIGKKQFSELLRSVAEIGEASNKKVHLTSLTLGK